MRYMMIIKATRDSEAGVPPNPELIAAINKLSSDAAARGEMVAVGGLFPSSQGVRIRAEKGKTLVIDGPFAETRELVGGFAIFDLASKAEAIESGRQFMQLHANILGPSYEGEMEIRPMFEPGDSCGQHT